MVFIYVLMVVFTVILAALAVRSVTPNGRAFRWDRLTRGIWYRVGAVKHYQLENRSSAIVRQVDDLADPVHIFFNPNWPGDLKKDDVFMICLGPNSDMPYLHIVHAEQVALIDEKD